ncbi:hypothetical protein ACIRBX_13885 [Kitasatospora sp. NPDC096147]|uniref:golvesin C-terminal-like domain-containing protein n=1 Tax=Kitasatospora sp. NPDC096147 TaxID=3364093 RepID=UPI0037F4298C
MHRTRPIGRRLTGVLLTTMLGTLLPLGIAPARAAPAPAPAPSSAPPAPAEVPEGQRSALLGSDWTTSKDRAWTVSGDAEGLHLLVADRRDGYAWRTAASLSEPGFEADQWIGNACVTGSGERAVVVYAPRTFTNEPELLGRGGFVAVVDLTGGQVTKLPFTTTLAHFNPGCGADEKAVLTQSRGAEFGETRLLELDTTTGRSAEPIAVKGQLTSAVPLRGGGIAAADGARIVRLTAGGGRTTLAEAASVPYYLTPGRDGGLTYLERKGSDGATAEHLPGRALDRAAGHPVAPRRVAEGKRTELGLSRGGDQVYVVGRPKGSGRNLPDGVSLLPDLPGDAEVSTEGRAVVRHTAWADGQDSRPSGDAPLSAVRPAAVDLRLVDTGKDIGFTVDPTARVSDHAAEGSAGSPALPEGVVAPEGVRSADGQAASRSAVRPALGALAQGDPANPVEAERICSVPRNDPRNQAMQPKPRQVEWAVDQAVTGNLDAKVQRPANWKNLGMPAYKPQSLVSSLPLEGGGRVPAQILLGVAAQESNLWQAARSAVPGVTANPLIGNFYGVDVYNENPADDWVVDWAKADCGYGVTQVTDHMRMAGREGGKGGTAWDYESIQRPVALDYTANIAVGLTILQSKWNETRAAGLTVNNGDPSKLENWFFALWAYNTGFNPQFPGGEPWGLGWVNNPANPIWDAGRGSFLDASPSDAARPQNWPYPEKVLGFAAHGFSALESPGVMVGSFRTAWWNGVDNPSDPYAPGTSKANRRAVKPPESLFCEPMENQCYPDKISDGASNQLPSAGPCGRADSKCWWHKSVTWKTDCAYSCGNELIRFNSTYPEEADGTAYPPNCSLTASASGYNSLPAGSLVVDDVPDGTPSVRPNCGRPWTNAGRFTMDFSPDANGTYASKIDLHQLGAGFGGHFYFTHTRERDARGGIHEMTGTWSLNQARKGWTRILVHLPDHGAQTQQAKYEIDTGSGLFLKDRYVNQVRLANGWVSLGVFEVDGVPRVRLGSVTADGTGDEDVAWDAVAFTPLPGKPKDVVVQLGDSYASGEGAKPYAAGTDVGPYASIPTQQSTARSWNACRRSQNSWARKTVLPGRTVSIGSLADSFDSSLDFQSVACSGAYTFNVGTAGASEWGRLGQHHEMPQLASGFVDPSTTLVALTIGGNDADFGPIVAACGDPTKGCPSDATVRGKISALVPKLTSLLDRIAAEAPEARIVLLGYPRLFNSAAANIGCTVMGNLEQQKINDWAVFMKDEQVRAVANATAKNRITFRWADSEFEGYRVCDATPGINDLVAAPTGPGDFSCPGIPLCPSMESYHPNNPGTGRYALALQNALTGAVS